MHKPAVPRLLAMLCILAVFIPPFFMQGRRRGLFGAAALAWAFRWWRRTFSRARFGGGFGHVACGTSVIADAPSRGRMGSSGFRKRYHSFMERMNTVCGCQLLWPSFALSVVVIVLIGGDLGPRRCFPSWIPISSV